MILLIFLFRYFLFFFFKTSLY
uniref:Uncharacterized protein n=1 Tax=Anguilla anguilla TaxID=7936 RepID=A0A0E9P6B9_ANGAN